MTIRHGPATVLGSARFCAGQAPSRMPLEPRGPGKAGECRPKSVDLRARIAKHSSRGRDAGFFILSVDDARWPS